MTATENDPTPESSTPAPGTRNVRLAVESNGRVESDFDAGSPYDGRRASGLAVVAAGLAVVGFVSLFRLRSGWDRSMTRAFRRLLGVQIESVAGVTLGLVTLRQLRSATEDRRGIPFALVAVVLGGSNLVRSVMWIRSDGRNR